MNKFYFLIFVVVFAAAVGNVNAASSSSMLAAGPAHTCAIMQGVVKCWGKNDQGQLGNGTTVPSNIPVAVKGLPARTVRALIAGKGAVTCALLEQAPEQGVVKQGYDLWCFGTNINGLARGNRSYNGMTTSPVLVPLWEVAYQKDDKGKDVLVNGKKVKIEQWGVDEVAIGGTHILARIGGHVYSWGEPWGSPKPYGALGRLTNFSKKDAFEPTRVPAWDTAVSVAAGGQFSCVALASGKVSCSGGNSYGSLGNGTRGAKSLEPTEVQGIMNAAMVVAGGQFACAVLADNTGKCWGVNTQGELGDGTVTMRLAPVAIKGLKNSIKQLRAGFEYICATLMDNNVQCWGQNSMGQLGDGTKLADVKNKNSIKPIDPKDLGVVTELSAGGNHACVVKAEGGFWCWGDDTLGQLGDGMGLVPKDLKKNNGQYKLTASSMAVKVK